MARSRIGIRARWMRYRLIPTQRRDIFDFIEMLTGFY